jgi:predicted Zn-dependent protease
LAFCNPLHDLPPDVALFPRAARKAAAWTSRRLRGLTLALGLVGGLFVTDPAAAQGLMLLRDTETERALRSYEDPLLKAGGLDPAGVKIYLVNDNSVNAFVAEGQNMFIQSGMILFAHNSLELKGVMAHETGHIVAGHLSRDSEAIQKATIPMLLSMVIGIAAIAAGAGQAGMLILMGGQGIAQQQFNAFSRVQEATADQIALKLLDKTHQSSRGLVATFSRLADEEARAYDRMDPYASDHPMGRERVGNLENLVEASPYKDVPEDPAVEHEYEMIQAKLYGYVAPIQDVMNKFPASDTSKPARYARAMAFSRKPDLPKALSEINSLIKDEPANPYFYEVLGQIYVSMAKPDLGVAAYQKSVDLLPDAPQLRVALAAAQLATERPGLAQPALANLKVALQQDSDDPFAWYEAAQGYSMLGNESMADLATAERYYSVGAMGPAAQFAGRARHGLTQGSPDWQRANDIVAIAVPLARLQQR